MQQESSLEVIGKFHAFSGVNTIPTNGIALFTVQKDRSTEFRFVSMQIFA
jgi:hypothetical protein